MDNEYIRRKFAEYYDKHDVIAPPMISQREWGAGTEKKIDWRHLQFADAQALNTYVRTNVPLYISYSASYYEFPDARPMENKNWLGADLVFDLDTDEFEAGCKHSHDWSCDNCIQAVAHETNKLIEEFLIPDFGFARKDLTLVFTGNRGYHVHIRREDVLELDQNARKEISDYITSSNMSLNHIGMNKAIRPSESGWGRKISDYLANAVKSSSVAEELKERIGERKKNCEKMLEDREATLKKLRDMQFYALPMTPDAIKKLLVTTAADMACKIDTNVTMDVSRLMRLPSSLHGDTGFIAKEIKSLDGFDPFKDAIVFSDKHVKVKAKKDAEARLKDERYNLTKGAELELPEYAAIYFVCRGVASVI